jgi:hypothetical protein
VRNNIKTKTLVSYKEEERETDNNQMKEGEKIKTRRKKEADETGHV